MGVGALVVSVIANTAKARKDLKSFRGDVKSTGKTVGASSRSFRTLRTSISGLIGPLAAAAGAALSFRAFNAVAATLDRTAKVARKLGIASEELAGLRHAAEQTAGVTGGTLDMALQRMTRRIAEAAQGSGEAVSALEELGLSAEQLNKQTPDEAFRRVAEAMKTVEGRSDKVRLAFKLFDSEGVDLVNTLDLGADGLKKMTAEAKRLGVALDEADLAKVEAYNDAMDRLQKSAGSLGSSLVIEAAPGLTDTVDSLTEAVQGLKSFKVPDNWVTDLAGRAGRSVSNAYMGFGAEAYRRVFDDNGGGRGQLTQEEQIAQARREEENRRRNSAAGRERDRQRSAAAEGNRRRAATAAKNSLGTKAGRAVEQAKDGVASGFKSLGSLVNRTEFSLKQWGSQAQAQMTRGINPITGLPSLGKSDARAALEQQRAQDNAPRGLNALVDANSREGYMALRANLGRGGDDVTKNTAKTAKYSLETARGVAQSARWLGDIASAFTNAPAPLSIPGG